MRVLSDPEIDLFFKVSLVSVPIKVVEVEGKLNLFAPVEIWLEVADKAIVPALIEVKVGEEVVDIS